MKLTHETRKMYDVFWVMTKQIVDVMMILVLLKIDLDSVFWSTVFVVISKAPWDPVVNFFT